MTLSFVIPAYNEAKNIGPCLQSIKDELGRTVDPATGEPMRAEIVVVNNASTDKTREKALEFSGVTVVNEPLKGLVLARRAGFVVTGGELVANVDADTKLPEGWLKTVIEEFERDPHLVALSGPFIYYDLPVYQRAMVKFFYGLAFLLYFVNRFVLRVGSMVQGGNFVLRRAAWESVGGYDTSITFYGEDTDIAKRLSGAGNVKWTFKLPMYTSGRRLRGEGIMRTSLRYSLNYFWVTFFGKPLTYRYKDVRPPR